MSYLRALSIDHANMNVRNLQESVDFYSTLFGFELKKDQPEHQSKILGNDRIKLCFYENPWKYQCPTESLNGSPQDQFTSLTLMDMKLSSVRFKEVVSKNLDLSQFWITIAGSG